MIMMDGRQIRRGCGGGRGKRREKRGEEVGEMERAALSGEYPLILLRLQTGLNETFLLSLLHVD
jgi:hypothetical protein